MKKGSKELKSEIIWFLISLSMAAVLTGLVVNRKMEVDIQIHDTFIVIHSLQFCLVVFLLIAIMVNFIRFFKVKFSSVFFLLFFGLELIVLIIIVVLINLSFDSPWIDNL